MRTYPHDRQAAAAVRSAAKHTDWRTFRKRPNKSMKIRNRNVRSRIAGRFSHWTFEDGNLDCLPVRIWKAHENEQLLNEVISERFLTSRTPMRKFVLDQLPEFPSGTYIRHSDITELRTPSDSSSARNARWTLADVGLVTKETAPDGSPTAYVNRLRVPATALIILLHNIAPKAETTAPVSEIECHEFWRLLGVPDFSVVRYVLRKAANARVIDYERNGDRLESITTLHDLDKLIYARFSLD